MGYRYGSAPLREKIEQNEFKAIIENSQKIMFCNKNLIEYLYELDTNDVGEQKYYKLKSKYDLFENLPVNTKVLFNNYIRLLLKCCFNLVLYSMY